MDLTFLNTGTHRFLRQMALTGLAVFYAAPAFTQGGSPVLDVYGTQVRAVSVAIPKSIAGDPAPSAQWRLDFDTRLRKAIGFHGALAPMRREAELEDNSPFGTFQAAIWRATGAELLLSSRVAKAESEAVAEIHLFDIAAGEAVLSKRYRSPDANANRLVDAIADDIVATLLGITPPFSEPIAFQYRQPGNKWRELYTTDWSGEETQQRTNNQKLILHPHYIPGTDRIIAIGYRSRTPALRYFDLARNTERALIESATTMHGPTAMPDGRHVVFAWERNRNTDLYLLDLESGNTTRLSTSTAADLSPTVSPDGKRVTFVSDRRGNPYLYLLDIESRNVEPLIMEGTYLGEPDWSPDGKRLVFVRRDRGTGFAIWTYEFASQRLQKITEDLGDSIESPAWGPDSRTILFTRLNGNSYDIWKVDRLLQQPSRLTRLPGDARMATWRSSPK